LHTDSFITTCSELRKVLFFGAVCDFLFVYKISPELLNIFVPNSQERGVWSLACTSLNAKVNGQRSKVTRDKKTAFFSPLIFEACCVFCQIEFTLVKLLDMQQGNGDSQEQVSSRFSCKANVTTDAIVFPKVDICVLFPNVFTRQEVINDSLENLLQFVTVFCPVLNKSEVVFCLTADVGTVCAPFLWVYQWLIC